MISIDRNSNIEPNALGRRPVHAPAVHHHVAGQHAHHQIMPYARGHQRVDLGVCVMRITVFDGELKPATIASDPRSHAQTALRSGGGGPGRGAAGTVIVPPSARCCCCCCCPTVSRPNCCARRSASVGRGGGGGCCWGVAMGAPRPWLGFPGVVSVCACAGVKPASSVAESIGRLDPKGQPACIDCVQRKNVTTQN